MRSSRRLRRTAPVCVASGVTDGHDDDRLAGLVEPHRLPQRHEPLLEAGEARAALVAR